MAELSASQLALALLFGSSACLYALLYVSLRLAPVPASEDKDKEQESKLTKPFTGDLASFITLSRELTLVGCIIGLTYLAEHHPPYPHSTKDYNSDFFWFVVFLLGAFATLTLHKHKDLEILGRAQTEEWKGWMQFIFLAYHYFHAENVYNAVRIMITCYVWMTGFGNFSFFYIKQDFSWVRVAQMLWRLNFAVLLLCMAHNNTYILYYICPLHTFFFFMVYGIMRTLPNLNRTKWGIRWKLFAAACIIFVLWDLDLGVFELCFGWLSRNPVVGAKNGTLWEWYFRTSLDHWSTLLGMIFALNYPMTTLFFRKMEAEPPAVAHKTAAVAGGLFVCLLIWWSVLSLPMEKISYNMSNAYYGVVPLTSYLFLRNIHPSVRGWVSGGLHDLGKTTLETYLLQHHIWLTSNAKTLLTLVPSSPYMNFGVTTVLFFYLSQKLYRVTMSLRGMILPDDHKLCVRNGGCAAAALLVAYTLGLALRMLNASWLLIIVSCFTLALGIVIIAKRCCPCAEDKRLHFIFLHVYKFVGFCLLVMTILIAKSQFLNTPVGTLSREPISGLLSSSRAQQIGRCTKMLTSGGWEMRTDCEEQALVVSCVAPHWIWRNVDRDCEFSQVTSSHVQIMFQDKFLLFVGDSITRNVFHAFNAMLDGSSKSNGADFEIHNYSSSKHSDIWKFHESSNTTVGFLWRPFLADQRQFLALELQDAWFYGAEDRRPDAVFLGVGLWDVLYNSKHMRANGEIPNILKKLKGKQLQHQYSTPVVSWLLPTNVVEEAMPEGEKKSLLTTSAVTQYTKLLLESGLAEAVDFVIDGHAVTEPRRNDAFDGIHYTAYVYRVMAQIYINGIKQFPAFRSTKSSRAHSGGRRVSNPAKRVGSMASPIHGLGMLALIALMLFYMDAFFGIARATLYWVAGIRMSHDEAYSAFIKATALPCP